MFRDRLPKVTSCATAELVHWSRILGSPTRWRVIEEDIRRCLTHVFPYAILYTIEQDFFNRCCDAFQPRAELLETPCRMMDGHSKIITDTRKSAC